MNIFEQCTVDGDLTPELIKRKQELDKARDEEISAIKGNEYKWLNGQWVSNETLASTIRQKYDDIWEQELSDAGYIVRPIFESADSFSEWYDELSKLNEALQTYRITYYEDDIKKSFTVQASSKAEAEQIGWSRVDADSLYVSEEGK